MTNSLLPYPLQPDLDEEKPLPRDVVLRGLLGGIARAQYRHKQKPDESLCRALRALGTSVEREIDQLHEGQRERARRWAEENR